MNKTSDKDIIQLPKLTVTTEELASMLSCGIVTAREIGEKSGARLDLPTRRTLWSVDKVREFIIDTAY